MNPADKLIDQKACKADGNILDSQGFKLILPLSGTFQSTPAITNITSSKGASKEKDRGVNGDQ